MWSLIFYETNYNYAKPRFSAQVTSFETLWLNQPSRRWGVLYVACKRSILVALNQISCGVCLFKCFDLSLCWGGTECTHSPKRQGGQFQLQQIIFWIFWGSAYNRQSDPMKCKSSLKIEREKNALSNFQIKYLHIHTNWQGASDCRGGKGKEWRMKGSKKYFIFLVERQPKAAISGDHSLLQRQNNKISFMWRCSFYWNIKKFWHLRMIIDPPPFHTSSLTVKRQFFYNFTKGSPQNTTLRIFLVKGASASMLSRLVGGVLWETLGQPHNRALHIENTGQIIICFSEWCEFECSQGRWKVCFLKKTRNCE